MVHGLETLKRLNRKADSQADSQAMEYRESVSDRQSRLPQVLRAYAPDATMFRVSDSGLGAVLEFAASTIEELQRKVAQLEAQRGA